MNAASPTKTFLLQIGDDNIRNQLEQMIMMLVSEVDVFTESKVPPRVLVTDQIDLNRWLSDSTYGSTALICLKKLPDEDAHLDDIVSNKIQVAAGSFDDESRMLEIFNRALKFSFEFGRADFKQRSLQPGETLFKSGDPAGHIYLLKKGKLKVHVTTLDGEKDLGWVQPGDFVGEMAYFNQEPRSASVSATEPSDLIEIPINNFEAVLMQKPLWCKKILQMMSKRIKEMNKVK